MTTTSIKLESHTNTGFSLRLPREHGAVVTFVLASFLCLCLCQASPLVLFKLALIWLLFLSLHNSRQLLLTTALAIALMLFFGVRYECLLPVVLISCAPPLMRWMRKRAPVAWSETAGMLGVSATPFLFVSTADTSQIETLTVAGCFCASTLIATALVRAARADMKVKPTLPLFISFCLWLAVSPLAPALVAVCLAPFVVEAIWLLNNSRRSFRALGIAGTICMLAVTVSLTFWLSCN